MTRIAAYSYTGEMLFVGYRVQHNHAVAASAENVGEVEAILPDDVVEVRWPNGGITRHSGSDLLRVGGARENEARASTRDAYAAAPTDRATRERW